MSNIALRSFILCILVLISITSAFNVNTRIINIATKKIAAATLVAVGLVGLPDQILSFSPASVAHAAEAKSIFDGFYNDPNHPGCLVRMQCLLDDNSYTSKLVIFFNRS